MNIIWLFKSNTFLIRRIDLERVEEFTNSVIHKLTSLSPGQAPAELSSLPSSTKRRTPTPCTSAVANLSTTSVAALTICVCPHLRLPEVEASHGRGHSGVRHEVRSMQEDHVCGDHSCRPSGGWGEGS